MTRFEAWALGYPDKLCVRPGETVRFHVSGAGAETVKRPVGQADPWRHPIRRPGLSRARGALRRGWELSAARSADPPRLLRAHAGGRLDPRRHGADRRQPVRHGGAVRRHRRAATVLGMGYGHRDRDGARAGARAASGVLDDGCPRRSVRAAPERRLVRRLRLVGSGSRRARRPCPAGGELVQLTLWTGDPGHARCRGAGGGTATGGARRRPAAWRLRRLRRAGRARRLQRQAGPPVRVRRRAGRRPAGGAGGQRGTARGRRSPARVVGPDGQRPTPASSPPASPARPMAA